jgi:hypothetical protein
MNQGRKTVSPAAKLLDEDLAAEATPLGYEERLSIIVALPAMCSATCTSTGSTR